MYCIKHNNRTSPISKCFGLLNGNFEYFSSAPSLALGNVGTKRQALLAIGSTCAGSASPGATRDLVDNPRVGTAGG